MKRKSTSLRLLEVCGITCTTLRKVSEDISLALVDGRQNLAKTVMAVGRVSFQQLF